MAAHDEKEDQRADTAHQHGDIGVKAHEDRREDGRAEHGDNVLDAERKHLAGGKPLVGGDDALGLELPVREVTHKKSLRGRGNTTGRYCTGVKRSFGRDAGKPLAFYQEI